MAFATTKPHISSTRSPKRGFDGDRPTDQLFVISASSAGECCSVCQWSDWISLFGYVAGPYRSYLGFVKVNFFSMIVYPITTNWMELIECYRRLLSVVCVGGITWFPIEEKCGKQTLLVSYITIIWSIMKEGKCIDKTIKTMSINYTWTSCFLSK